MTGTSGDSQYDNNRLRNRPTSAAAWRRLATRSGELRLYLLKIRFLLLKGNMGLALKCISQRAKSFGRIWYYHYCSPRSRCRAR